MKLEQVKAIEATVAVIKEACHTKQQMANETKNQAIKAKQQAVKRFSNAMKAFREKEMLIRELPELISEETLKDELAEIETMCDKEVARAEKLVQDCAKQAAAEIKKRENDAAKKLKDYD